MKKLIFFVSIILISLATFYKALNLDLRGEDWVQLWIVIQPDLKNLIFKTVLFRDHPISTYQEIIFSKFFGFNPFYWHLFGYFLKVIDSLAVGLLVFGITNSRKAALYSSLIFAASVIGLEAFVTLFTQTSAMIIFFMCLGLYFWIISGRENSLKKYMFSLIFFTVAFLGDPGRGVSMIVLGIFWDLLSLKDGISKKSVAKITSRIFFLITVVLGIYLATGAGVEQFKSGHPGGLMQGLQFITANFTAALNNFSKAIGFLIVGWFIPLFESGHMSSMTHSGNWPLILGYTFLIATFFIAFKFFSKKNTGNYKIPLFFAIWIIITFFPTWLLIQWYVGELLPGVSGRYLAISSVGWIGLLGYGLSRIKVNYGLFLFLLIIIFNIWNSNRILKQELVNRSALLHNMFWDEVDQTIVKDQKDNIIMFIGVSNLTAELVSTYAMPFGLRRGITKAIDLPITTGDRELVKKLLCEGNVYPPNFLEYARVGSVLQKEKIPITHLYVWRVYEDSFTNVTDQERERLRSEVDCKLD